MQILDRASHSDGIPEIANNSLRNEVVERILNGQPIVIPKHKDAIRRNGDMLIHFWSHTQVLLQLCKEEGIDMTADRLPLYLETDEINSDTAFPLFSRALEAFTGFSFIQGRQIIASEATILSQALGVNIAPKQLHDMLTPLPLRTNIGPLKDYDETIARTRAREIQGQKDPTKRHVTVFQSGSNRLKRYTDEQVAELVQAARDNYGDCVVTVITDKDRLTIPETQYGANSVIANPNINDLIAHFMQEEDLYIGTDTFWMWLLAASQNLVEAHAKQLYLFPLADTEIYGLPNAYNVESEAIFWARKIGILDNTAMITQAYYQNYAVDGYGARHLEALPSRRALEINSITPSDIRNLKATIKRLAA